MTTMTTVTATAPCTCRRPCMKAHQFDLTKWCSSLSQEYLSDLASGWDWMGGIDPATGRPVRGFGGHEESLEVIEDYLRGLATEYGGFDGGPTSCGETGEPTAEDWAEARDEADHDGFAGLEERMMDAFTLSDLAWAAENLDPTSRRVAWAAERGPR